MTYGELDAALRFFGAAVHESPKAARVYTFRGSGALVAVPPSPFERTAYPHHISGAITEMESFGIASRQEFERRFLNAG